jgi:hypothetical protein
MITDLNTGRKEYLNTMTESRAPIALPGYTLGDDGTPAHFTATIPRETAALEAKELTVGDAAFILRSGHKWAYAKVIEKEEKDGTTLRFEVDMDKNRKTFPEAVWGKYIRVIKVDDSEMAKLEAEAVDHAQKEAEVPAKVAEPKKEAKKEGSKSVALVLGEFSSEVGSWFSSKLNSMKTKETRPAAAASENKDSLEPVPPSLESDEKPAVATTKEKDKTMPQIGTLFSSMFSEKSEEPKTDPKNEDVEIATKEKSKSKPHLGAMFSSMFGEKPKEPKSDPKKDDAVKATTPVTSIGKDEPKTQTEESTLAQIKVEKADESKPTATAAEPSTATQEKETPSPASSPAQGEAPEAALPKPPSSSDETRDAVEEKPSLTPAVPTEATSGEGKSTLASPAPVTEPPASEPEPPTPIKLLKTPFKFYKAASMKEDPAEVALAATSFADDHEGYGSLQSDGVVVCKHDPAAAANAEMLGQERVRDVMESQGLVSIAESNAELRKQGVVIVEAE